MKMLNTGITSILKRKLERKNKKGIGDFYEIKTNNCKPFRY